MAYQWYNEQRRAAKESLSTDYIPGGGGSSQLPPGIAPASLAAPGDHGEAIASNTFTALEGGTRDIDGLMGASRSYASRFASGPVNSLQQTSMALGPAEAGAATNGAPFLSGMTTTQPALDESVNPLGSEVTQSYADNVIRLQPISVTADSPQPIDHRNESGRREKGNALTGVVACVKDAVVELWELAKEIFGLLKDAGFAAAYFLTDGWVGSEKDWLALKQRLDAIRAEMEGVAGAGIEFLAALDVHYPWVVKTNPLLMALVKAFTLFYTKDEWAAKATAGKAKAHKIVDDMKKTYEEDPDYAIGYIICTLLMMLSPRALVSILKNARKIGKLGAIIKRAEGAELPGGGRPKPKAPTGIVDGTPEQGKPTPQGGGPNDPPQTKSDRNASGRGDPEGQVRPNDYVTPDTPGARDVGNPQGMPTHTMPGREGGTYPRRTDDELRAAGLSRDIPEYRQDMEVVDGLRGRGYDVDYIDDPIDKQKRGSGNNPNLRPGDYAHTKGKLAKNPDLRVNGVTFDIFRPASPDTAIAGIEKKLQAGQARNFVLHVDPSKGSVRQYLDRLNGIGGSGNPGGGYLGERLRQVIVVDQRTGQTAIWTRPSNWTAPR